jgi:hypothetical protein
VKAGCSTKRRRSSLAGSATGVALAPANVPHMAEAEGALVLGASPPADQAQGPTTLAVVTPTHQP